MKRPLRIPEPKTIDRKIMLDSGAFTAWTQNEKIDIDDYIDYINRNKKNIHTYFNLDVIPGKPGQKRTPEIVEASAKASYANLQIMRKRKMNPIPVFHQLENFKWLDKLLDDGHDYIAVGGIAGSGSILNSRQWLDRVFTRLTDKKGWPLINVHGLGVASFELLFRYPWYSCDATSWALTAAFGAIFVPVYRNARPCFTLPPVKLTVSLSGRPEIGTDHVRSLSPSMRKLVEHYLATMGLTISQVEESYKFRAQVNVHFYKELEKATELNKAPFKHRLRSVA